MGAVENISFRELQTISSIQDLLLIINQVKKRLYGEFAKTITLRQFTFYLYPREDVRKYSVFEIPKKHGGKRTITAPCQGLKVIQQCINQILLDVYTPHPAAMGFVKDRSIVDNARTHVGQKYVYNIDLKDFFPSIKAGRVYAKLMLKPLCFSKEIASIITNLCCNEGCLPQGAPTSPILSNIVCERLDNRLTRLAFRYNLKYSRYADDITFSGMTNVFHEDGQFVQDLKEYVEKEYFQLNPKKTRLNSYYERQEVTGLVVNQQVNVCEKYIKELRVILHNWEVKGYKETARLFFSHYHSSKNRFDEMGHYMENIIEGKLNYLQMIKGKKNSTYVKLHERYKKLMADNLHLQEVISIWEKQGVADAMEFYKNEKKSCTLMYNRIYGDVNSYKLQSCYEIEGYSLEEFNKKYGGYFEFELKDKKYIATFNGKCEVDSYPIYCKYNFNPQELYSIYLYKSKKGYYFWLCQNDKVLIGNRMSSEEIQNIFLNLKIYG